MMILSLLLSRSIHAEDKAFAPGAIVDQEGADPFVVQNGSGYLYTKTTGDDIRLCQAASLTMLGAAREVAVYNPGSALSDLWAPELWRLDDAWYIYFAAVVPGESLHHMYVLQNTSEDPSLGEWTLHQMAGMDEKWAIDGTILETGGRRYFVWSGWEGDENVRQDIYLAEMVSPLEILPEKICLSTPQYPWETVGDPKVNEGPEAIVRGNTINLVYSASGSWTDDYCLGLLTLSVGEDVKVVQAQSFHIFAL